MKDKVCEWIYRHYHAIFAVLVVLTLAFGMVGCAREPVRMGYTEYRQVKWTWEPYAILSSCGGAPACVYMYEWGLCHIYAPAPETWDDWPALQYVGEELTHCYARNTHKEWRPGVLELSQ